MKSLLLNILCLASFGTCLAQDNIEAKYGDAIKRELLEMKFHIKADRQNLFIVTAECGYNSKEAVFGRYIYRTDDSVMLLKVKSIIHVYGYLGPKIIGDNASQVMFDVIYNSNANTAKTFIPIIWQALLKGDATAVNYAALVDKVALQELNTQVYGTIVQRRENAYYAPFVTDTLKVDSLRKRIGLPTFEAYMKQINAN